MASFTFGCPDRTIVARLQGSGTAVWCTVTGQRRHGSRPPPASTRSVVQGSEAGGHQGSFDDTDAAPVGLLALLQLVRATIDLPLVAAGGIANGEGVASVIAAGASAAQIGSCLMLTPEAGTSAPHRAAFAGAAPTALTRSFSGRRARGIVNRFMRDHDAAAPVALAQSGPGECAESEPGRYRVRFLLASEAAVYSALGRLLERVRHWRATEVYEGDELVSTYQAKEMAWCASFQLNYFGECRERFQWGVMPRCALCPLFDSERALGVGKREEPVPGERFEMAFDLHDAALIVGADFAMITNLDYLFDSDLMAVLEGEIPEWLDLSALIPDSPPEDWPETRPMLDGDEDA